ncbi:MAG: hypothetical protein ACP5FH_07335 [Terracidiphilus sp.]
MNPSFSRALSAFDLRQNFVASFHYLIPQPNDANRLHWLGSGWAVAGIARFTTGLPVTMLNNNDTSLLGTIPNGINNNGADTPDWSGEPLHLNLNPRGGRPVFDTSEFTLPALGTMGNARRRFFSGPGMENIDMTLQREIFFGGSRAMELRLEAYNVANRTQFSALLRSKETFPTEVSARRSAPWLRARCNWPRATGSERRGCGAEDDADRIEGPES